jgi:hypothetical protein
MKASAATLAICAATSGSGSCPTTWKTMESCSVTSDTRSGMTSLSRSTSNLAAIACTT